MLAHRFPLFALSCSAAARAAAAQITERENAKERRKAFRQLFHILVALLVLTHGGVAGASDGAAPVPKFSATSSAAEYNLFEPIELDLSISFEHQHFHGNGDQKILNSGPKATVATFDAGTVSVVIVTRNGAPI
jgi:hypothetical protein